MGRGRVSGLPFCWRWADVAGALDGGAEAGGREGVGAGELFVEGAFVGVLQLHEDAVVGPA